MSIQDGLPAMPVMDPEGVSVFIHPNQTNKDEDVNVRDIVMADSGPDDHNRTAPYSENASLMQTSTFVPAQSPAFRWR